jgi:uncharacterized protein (TIGR04255 family)
VQHPAFRNPPIVEAIASVRFVGGTAWTEAQRVEVIERLKQSYPGEVRQEYQVQVETTLTVPTPTTTTRSAPARVLMPTADGLALVGLFLGDLSVHVLQPYPGWNAFRQRVAEAMEIVTGETGSQTLSEVAVRYIDRIALPHGSSPSLDEYFTSVPERPASMPSMLSAFQSIVQSRDPDTGTIAVLTTTTVPPSSSESFAMLYDLNLVRQYGEAASLPVDDYLDVLDALHSQQYEIFCESITDKTRELFE